MYLLINLTVKYYVGVNCLLPLPFRFQLRGIRHLVFYSLPLYHEFYPEIINSLEPGSDVTVTVLYSHYDSLRLARVVGSVRARRMLAARERVHMLVTGDPAVGERKMPRQKDL